MSECISIDVPSLPVLPSPFTIPSFPTISFGGGDFCCLVKIPLLTPKLPFDIPTTTAVPLVAAMNVSMEALNTYFRELAKLGLCPND